MQKLLVVVDYQNDFVDGSLGFPEAVTLHDKICQKIIDYKEDGQMIVFTMDTHESDYDSTQEGRSLPVAHCIRGTGGHDLHGKVQNLSMEYEKFEKSTFGSDLLYEYLKKSSYDSIEFVGLVSNICVLSNAVLAKTALPEALIIVDASCTASYDQELHEKTLDVLEGLQVRITNAPMKK